MRQCWVPREDQQVGLSVQLRKVLDDRTTWQESVLENVGAVQADRTTAKEGTHVVFESQGESPLELEGACGALRLVDRHEGVDFFAVLVNFGWLSEGTTELTAVLTVTALELARLSVEAALRVQSDPDSAVLDLLASSEWTVA